MGAYVSGSTPVYDVITVYPPGQAWNSGNGTPGAPAWFDRGGFTVSQLETQATAQLPDCTKVDTP